MGIIHSFKTKVKKDFLSFMKAHKAALIVLSLLLILRLMALYSLGFTYSLESDDVSYIESGIRFARTGTITMHDDYPSAQIMPGMTVLIGLFVLLFGEGKLLWIALKLLWICMGLGTAWFVYRSVCLFVPKWCGIIGMLPLFRADFIWMDNLILTETPFLLALTAMVYYTLRMGRQPGFRYFWPCAISYMAGLMLKANIALYPLFALVYLLVVKYDRKLLAKQCVVLAGIVLCFVIPWSIRNYVQFRAFVPLTYGAGNPTLLGTYQGEGFPSDDILDYETNVEKKKKKKYADYYDNTGKVLPQYQRYVSLQKDEIKAAYRQQVWWDTDYKKMLYSYGVIKPQTMIESVFYWDTVFDQPIETLQQIQRVDLYLCIASLVAALVLKRHRKPMLFITAVYLGNIYIYSMTYAFSRYNASLMSMRFILLGIGAGLLVLLLKRGMDTMTAKG